MARTLKLTVAYDGTEFAGWQRQARERTVQAAIEDAISPIEKSRVTVIGAGRTDAGVHAAGQVVSVSLQTAISCDELRRALNATLPEDVRVIAAAEAARAFNARHDAKLKTYHYTVWNGVAVPPSYRRYAWHVPQPLDLDAMNEAAAILIGAHDFAAFQASGSDVKTTVRRLMASAVRDLDAANFLPRVEGDRLLRYEVTGSGFLRHMVRNIIGTLADVGRQRLSVAQFAAILESRDRGEAGRTAPPQGLVLWQVEY